jgi:hypothetical protein
MIWNLRTIAMICIIIYQFMLVYLHFPNMQTGDASLYADSSQFS